MDGPSCRRKKGREAFFVGGDPLHECPYNDHYRRADWLEGWHEGLCAFETEQIERKKHERIQELLCMNPSHILTVRDLLEIMDEIGDER